MVMMRTRRDFATTLAGAGAAGFVGIGEALADEGPPETTTIRIPYEPTICVAPAYIAQDLLRAEGFTDIRYVQADTDAVVRGQADFDIVSAAWLLAHLDTGEALTVLAGVHAGCYELFAREPIRTISDLKGKRVGTRDLSAPRYLYLAIMAAHVGLDPQKDIDWIIRRNRDFMKLFAEGEIDAFLAFPPEPQELRARKIGRPILSMATDKPWSQYLCCMAYGNRAFVREHPITTKRYLRAILKTADICADAPETAAQRLVDGGFTPRYDYALQTLSELPYASWRDFDPEDTMRFYALRLNEVGMIKSSPNKLIAEGTDWRFLNEIKRELKA
jgi:NitT/TauT family transport system substrate-binding protein